ncbi:hypothetical protein BDR26DRAFT_379652 [Obelidium mucronatum]|nr:hypothetical protein BDR26DRAFT_379652 [Obelidium mucronatum]
MSARKCNPATPKSKPVASTLSPADQQNVSISSTLHQMAFGFPQGAITKEAIDHFKLNEPEIPFYASLDKLQALVQYCTIKEYHDGPQPTVHIEGQAPSPLRVVIPFCVQAKASPYAMFINSNFYANSISGQFLVSRSDMENAFRALLPLKATPSSPYPQMPSF